MTGRSEKSAGVRGAFTLIELLIVVAIIAVLAGITLRVAVYVKQKTAKSQVIVAINQVKYVLTAYYAAYGSYPPAQKVGYEYQYTLPPAMPDGGLQFGTGLVYYIYSGSSYNPDPVAAEWQHYFDGLPQGTRNSGIIPKGPAVAGGFGMVQWTNQGASLIDPWWREFKYTSAAPDYQSYMIWSVGPNGIDEHGGGDDIGSGWVE